MDLAKRFLDRSILKKTYISWKQNFRCKKSEFHASIFSILKGSEN